MYLNDIDIKQFGGKLIYRNISSNRVSSGVKWEYYMDRPESFGSAIEFKDVQLGLILTADNETIFQRNLNLLAEEFRKGGVVKFKDMPYTYTMYLKTKPEYDKLNQTTYKVDLNLDGDFGLSDRKTVSGGNSLSVVNNGVYKTPVVLTVTLANGVTGFTINGFEHDFTMKGLPSGATVIIDTMNGAIKANGVNAIDKVESFHLPKLNVGESTIRTSSSCNMTIQFYERC